MTYESRIQEARRRFHESRERAEKKSKAGKTLRLLSFVVWTATIIIVGLSSSLYLTVAALAIAGIWTFSSYILRISEGSVHCWSATQSNVEDYMKNSPVFDYIKTLFEDIDQIGDIDFWFVRIYLDAMGEGFSVELVLNSDEDEVGFVQSYKHLYEVDPENEAMQEVYHRYLSYERNGYVAKNVRFRDELQSKSIWDFKKPDWLGEDNDCWYSISLHSFSEVSAEAYEIGERDIAAAAICKLARERGLRVERNEIDNGRRYILICLKF